VAPYVLPLLMPLLMPLLNFDYADYMGLWNDSTKEIIDVLDMLAKRLKGE
jgi:hypothetical protein